MRPRCVCVPRIRRAAALDASGGDGREEGCEAPSHPWRDWVRVLVLVGRFIDQMGGDTKSLSGGPFSLVQVTGWNCPGLEKPRSHQRGGQRVSAGASPSAGIQGIGVVLLHRRGAGVESRK